MASEVGSMASVWAHAEPAASSVTQVPKPPSAKMSEGRGPATGRRRGRGGAPSKKSTSSAELSTATNQSQTSPPNIKSLPDRSETSSILVNIASPSLPPKPSPPSKSPVSVPKPRRSNTTASAKDAETVSKESRVLSETAMARKSTRKRGRANSTKKKAGLEAPSPLEISYVPSKSEEPSDTINTVASDPSAITLNLITPTAKPESVSEEQEHSISTSTTLVTPPSDISNMTAADSNALVPVLSEHPRTITPTSQLDWADEDDADDLPDLDDWGITTKPRRKLSNKSASIPATSTLHIPGDSEKSRFVTDEPASTETDTSYHSESSSNPKIEISGVAKRMIKNALEKRVPTSKPIPITAPIAVPTSPSQLAPLDITSGVSGPNDAAASLGSTPTSASPTTAVSPKVVASTPLTATRGHRPPLDPEVAAARALEKKKARNLKLREKKLQMKLAKRAEKASAVGSGTPTPTTGALPLAIPGKGREDGGLGVGDNATSSSAGQVFAGDENGDTQPSPGAPSSSPFDLEISPKSDESAPHDGNRSSEQSSVLPPPDLTEIHPQVSATGPIRSRHSRPPTAPANSSSFDAQGPLGAGRRHPNPNQPFTFPSSRKQPSTAGPGFAPLGNHRGSSTPGPPSPYGAGPRPTRGGRGVAHQHQSTTRPVIASSALSQLSKSLSGGSRTHNSSAVTAES